jgi:ribosomal protein S12 methylthiotransferase
MRNNTIKKPITVGFISLGCPKNTVDSERMLAEIAQAGLIIVAEPESADVIVINTCGFIAPAREEALETVKIAIGRKFGGIVKKVVVAGCLSERMGKDLFREIPGIDAIVGLGQRDDIAKIIRKTFQSNKPSAYLGHSCRPINDDRVRLSIIANHWSYLRISEGCDHTCSFCTIPSIRGRFRSKVQDYIVAEAMELVEAGSVELNIIAQDTAYYGKDLNIQNGLAGLIRELEKVKGLEWIRLMYLYPIGITDELIETIVGSEKVVHYLDMPIQHINDNILQDMRRPDRKDFICRLIEKIRREMPDVVLRTTVIVGFPGETDEQFEELLEFIRWAKFDALGCFRYYAEAGTSAAEMPGHISDEVKEIRRDMVMVTQQEVAFSKNKERIGTELRCLVDSVDGQGNGQGRFYGQAPEIDSVCLISNCSSKEGEFIKAKVVTARDYDLVVEQISC